MTACSQWKDAIIDCALGSAPPADLRAHLADCEICSAALALCREKSAKLEAGMQSVTAVEPQPYGPERILARIASRPSGRYFWRWALVAFAAVVCVVAALKWPGRHGRGAPASIEALSSWRSPTESLLRSPADPLLRTVPRLGESFLDTSKMDRSQQ
jgi:anti-sigma factor RsiW